MLQPTKLAWKIYEALYSTKSLTAEQIGQIIGEVAKSVGASLGASESSKNGIAIHDPSFPDPPIRYILTDRGRNLVEAHRQQAGILDGSTDRVMRGEHLPMPVPFPIPPALPPVVAPVAPPAPSIPAAVSDAVTRVDRENQELRAQNKALEAQVRAAEEAAAQAHAATVQAQEAAVRAQEAARVQSQEQIQAESQTNQRTSEVARAMDRLRALAAGASSVELSTEIMDTIILINRMERAEEDLRAISVMLDFHKVEPIGGPVRERVSWIGGYITNQGGVRPPAGAPGGNGGRRQ